VRQLPRILANVAARHGRQVIITSHSSDLVADTGIDPSEILLLRTTGSETTVTIGSDLEELREAAKADMPLATHVEALTRPEDYAQLGLFGGKP
jgi:predicted ATP-dependent endonuclease of OLD family